MPSIPHEPHRPTREQVVTDLLKSIAMEEKALARLMEAEAAKVRAFVGKRGSFPRCPTPRQVLALNRQVFQLLDVVVMKEWLLLRKLQEAAALSPRPGPEDGWDRCEE